MVAQTNHQLSYMQWKINLTQVICLRIGKTTETKPHQVNLRSPLLRIHYYQNKRLQVKGILVPNTNLQLNLIAIPNWTCNVVEISHFNARISVRD